jgi:activator of HSP90 ATPase
MINTRRALLASFTALAATAAVARAQTPQMQTAPASDANRARTSLHQDVDFSAPPARLYAALTSSARFTAFSGHPAHIDPRAGGACSLFGGLVTARFIELVPNQRIVQAWRSNQGFGPGVYSLVKFELQPLGAGTRITLDQTGFPEGDYDHLSAGWPAHYWTPLHHYLGEHISN